MAKTECNKSPFIAIPASMGGIFLVVVILFLIFAKDQVVYLGPILWGFVILGIFATFFAHLSDKHHHKKK